MIFLCLILEKFPFTQFYHHKEINKTKSKKAREKAVVASSEVRKCFCLLCVLMGGGREEAGSTRTHCKKGVERRQK